MEKRMKEEKKKKGEKLKKKEKKKKKKRKKFSLMTTTREQHDPRSAEGQRFSIGWGRLVWFLKLNNFLPYMLQPLPQ